MKCSRASTISAGRGRRARARNWPALIACVLAWATGGQAQVQSQPPDLAGQSGSALEREVVVNTPEVRLSDLLASSAGRAERTKAEAIVLGRAPQPGSFRIFSAREIANAAAGRVELRAPAETVVRRGWAVTPGQVRQALAGFDTKNPTDWREIGIAVPQEITTRNRNARLEVVSVEPGRCASESVARLRCADRSDCGPFFVILHATAEKLMAKSARLRSPQPAAKPTLVEPGRKAWLVMSSGQMRITLPVFPLRRGGLGEMVRVLDPRAHRVLIAQVRGPGLLRSDLQEGR